MNSKPIGVFDSGLGGLTVVKEIIKALPHEDIVYLGDTARVPYGTRSQEVVTQFAKEDAQFLLKKGVKCIVIACNTASAFAYDYLVKTFNLPIFDVISSASEKALELGGNQIGVIGTRGTIDSKAYNKKLGQKLLTLACPLFVPLIEEGEIEGAIIKSIVKKYLQYFKGKPLKVLILGCTHYPIIKPEIERYLGSKILYIDPGKEVATKLNEYLSANKLLNSQTGLGKVDYYVTDVNNKFKETAKMFMGNGVSKKIRKVDIN